MIRQFFRGIGEAFRGIRRNLLVSFVCVSTVALCLLIVGVFVLVAMNLEFMAAEVESQVEIKVYLVEGVNEDFMRDLGKAVRSLTGVREVRLVTKEQALADLRDRFGRESGILEGMDELNPLPDSFDVRVDPELLDAIGVRIAALPGVESVQDKRELVDKLLALTRAIRSAGLFMACLLAVGALFIIANTIRVAVFTRRAEIAIMKLVGATDGFIRIPFIVEGMVLGLVGSGAAAAATWYGYEWVQLNVAQALPFLPVLPHDPTVWNIARLIVGTGVILGAMGSSISIRRYLRT